MAGPVGSGTNRTWGDPRRGGDAPGWEESLPLVEVGEKEFTVARLVGGILYCARMWIKTKSKKSFPKWCPSFNPMTENFDLQGDDPSCKACQNNKLVDSNKLHKDYGVYHQIMAATNVLVRGQTDAGCSTGKIGVLVAPAASVGDAIIQINAYLRQRTGQDVHAADTMAGVDLFFKRNPNAASPAMSWVIQCGEVTPLTDEEKQYVYGMYQLQDGRQYDGDTISSMMAQHGEFPVTEVQPGKIINLLEAYHGSPVEEISRGMERNGYFEFQDGDGAAPLGQSAEQPQAPATPPPGMPGVPPAAAPAAPPMAGPPMAAPAAPMAGPPGAPAAPMAAPPGVAPAAPMAGPPGAPPMAAPAAPMAAPPGVAPPMAAPAAPAPAAPMAGPPGAPMAAPPAPAAPAGPPGMPAPAAPPMAGPPGVAPPMAGPPGMPAPTAAPPMAGPPGMPAPAAPPTPGAVPPGVPAPAAPPTPGAVPPGMPAPAAPPTPGAVPPGMPAPAAPVAAPPVAAAPAPAAQPAAGGFICLKTGTDQGFGTYTHGEPCTRCPYKGACLEAMGQQV